ncbi:MAG: biopolymer transporter ExbD [Deltaproteobacteria bacterium]|nr:MAG: biopolymer transporter ExbD [Deltaproteobacteria bacterium]
MAADTSGNDGTISGINVTPLVDVMLVLLVIFMVTAPMIQQGVTVDLPAAAGAPLPGEDAPLVVSVTADGAVYLNDTPMAVDALASKLAAIVKERPSAVVYLRADEQARYGVVAKVVGALKRAGIQQLGLVSEPAEG